MKAQERRERLKRRRRRVRVKIKGTANVPRLSVSLSNKYIYTQLIDDNIGVTLASASSLEKTGRSGKEGSCCDIASAERVGEILAKRSMEKGVVKVVFDRGGHFYHGRVKAIAESARKCGLVF